MRTFIAVDISPEAQAEALRVQALWQDQFSSAVSWSRPDNLHITLKFLGEVPEERLPAISDAVAQCAQEADPFEVSLGEAHAFPNPRRPRVLVLNTPSEALVTLAACLEARLEPLGFVREHRRFQGHLTLGRVREGQRVENFLPPCNSVNWQVSELVLYQSHLSPQGSRYEVLARFPL